MRKIGLVPKEYGSAAALFAGMDRLHRAWGGLRPPPPLKKGDMMLLGILLGQEREGHPPVTTGQLARLMKQSPPGISQKVGSLEARGYLRRTADKQDRRMVYVELTDTGRHEADKAFARFWEGIEQALAKLGEAKTKELIALVNELSDAIEQGVGSGPKEGMALD